MLKVLNKLDKLDRSTDHAHTSRCLYIAIAIATQSFYLLSTVLAFVMLFLVGPAVLLSIMTHSLLGAGIINITYLYSTLFSIQSCSSTPISLCLFSSLSYALSLALTYAILISVCSVCHCFGIALSTICRLFRLYTSYRYLILSLVHNCSYLMK